MTAPSIRRIEPSSRSSKSEQLPNLDAGAEIDAQRRMSDVPDFVVSERSDCGPGGRTPDL